MLNNSGYINLHNFEEFNANSFFSIKQLKLINQKHIRKSSNSAYKDKSIIKEPGILLNNSTQIWPIFAENCHPVKRIHIGFPLFCRKLR